MRLSLTSSKHWSPKDKMAYNLNPSVRNRTHTFLSEPVQFQRGRGKTKTKKIQRKIRLRFMHILFYLILIGGTG
ncbi:hypothetical protein GH140_04255, partial [bacterium]|nr:hypothetical protein [bacterium]